MAECSQDTLKGLFYFSKPVSGSRASPGGGGFYRIIAARTAPRWA